MNICYRRLRPEREITMEIKDMRAFYAIVEEGNISHAAQRLDIAQPALSRQMKRLETSLGVQLFERGSRRIRLTDAGRVLYSRVEHILGMVDGTVREITEIGSGIAGSIQLGTITTSGALLLPELISEFHRRYPQVTYQIWEAEGARILELLDNRVIEIAITRTQVDSKVYESIVLPNEPLVVVMNKDQVIGASDSEVRMEELRDMPISSRCAGRDSLSRTAASSASTRTSSASRTASCRTSCSSSAAWARPYCPSHRAPC